MDRNENQGKRKDQIQFSETIGALCMIGIIALLVCLFIERNAKELKDFFGI